MGWGNVCRSGVGVLLGTGAGHDYLTCELPNQKKNEAKPSRID
jgi:hypothetical protein